MRLTATFPLVPGDLAVDSYVQIGPVGAAYRVMSIEHGPFATDVGGTKGVMAQMMGLATYTTDTRIVLEPVDAHDVPWEATATPLTVGDQ